MKQYLDNAGLGAHNAILLVRRPVLYTSQGYGALFFWRVLSAPAPFAYTANESSVHVLAIQEYSKGELSKETTLPVGIRSKKVGEIQHRSGKIWQITELEKPVYFR